MTNKNLAKNSFKGGAGLHDSLLRLLAQRPNSSTIELCILTGRSSHDVREALNVMRGQGRVKQVSAVSVALWASTGSVTSAQLEFRKPRGEVL